MVAAAALIPVGMSATIFLLDFVHAALLLVQEMLGTNIWSRSSTACCSCLPAMPCSWPAACRRVSDMGSRMNFAPCLPTIIVALALMLVGLLGTFVGALPDVSGISGEIGAWSLVAAAVVLLLGMIVEGI